MFRKQPLRTYERKRGVAKWHPIGSSSAITREDISPDPELKPPDFTNFDENNVTMEYDPFDTTFDRLAKDAIAHPVPQDRISNDSYTDSSSDAMPDKDVSSDDDPLFAEAFVNPEPAAKSKISRKSRNDKRPKIEKVTMTVTMKTVAREKKRRGKPEAGSRDENTEPNIELSKNENTHGTKKFARKKILRKKAPVVHVATTNFERKSEKRKNLEDSRLLKRCSVSLKRLNVSLDKSLAVTNRAQQSEGKKYRSDASFAGESSKIEESSEARTNDDYRSLNFTECDPTIVESPGNDEKRGMKIFKNPVVSLLKLSRTNKRLTIRDFSSSTPIFARVTTGKSSLHLSPITNNVNDETNDLEFAGLPSKSIVHANDSVSPNSTSTSSTVSSNERKIMKKRSLSKRSTKILSITPDPEPSGLLFDDTVSTNARTVSPILENLTEIIDATTNSPFMGFERESLDNESFQLAYNDVNPEIVELSSRNISENIETMKFPPFASATADENNIQTIRASINDPFMGFTGLQTDINEEQSISDKNPNNDDEWSTISGSIDPTRGKSIAETGENFERLSSGENTSSDEIAELISVNETIGDHSDGHESIVDADVSREIEIKSNIKNSRIDESRDLQPIVVLSRLTIGKITKIDDTVDIRDKRMTENLKKTSQLRMNDDAMPNSPGEESTSIGELSSRPRREMEIFSDTEESQIDMESLRVDDTAESMTEMEKSSIPKIPENDLSKYNEEFTIEYSTTSPSDFSSKSSDREKSIELAVNNENSKIRESRENVARAEENAIMKIHENRSSVVNERASFIQPIEQPFVLLTRLNDPFRITKRRNKYRDWDLKLSAISENKADEKISMILEEDTDNNEITNTPRINDIAEETISNESKIKTSDENSRVTDQIQFSQRTDDSRDASIGTDQRSDSTRDEKVVYLKPGKSWARSLSILSHIHNQEDFDFLAVGKGKKWRESVQSLLGMQNQGLIQSCVKKNEDDKEPSTFSGLRNSAAWVPGSSQPDTSRLLNVPSPGRFMRRVSIRVVPDCKSFDRIKDTSFLEAYGITQSENRKTIAQRHTLIAPRQTLEIVPETLQNSEKSRDVVLAQCGQKSSLPFEECYPDSYLDNCRKIGEGVYGEVFLYEKDSDKKVIKIIPIEGDTMINSERQKKFDEILSEIVIAKELHNLRFSDKSNTRGFIEVKNVNCVRGKYPEKLIELWRIFDEEKNSENDCPSIFEQDQLYIVLELGHGGEDLEAYTFQNAGETHALFIQTALALAVAEESLEFEHRDLHWGNLLISRTDESHIDFKLGNKSISVTSKGVKVSVIDFTLSRMSYQGCSIFNDLSLDDDMFVAQGEYQFDIYRLMRSKLENNWQRFEPFTNILWLHYILDKMITAVRYRRKNTKIHKNGLVKLQELKNEILEYKSALHFVTSCDKATRLLGSRSSVSTVASSI